MSDPAHDPSRRRFLTQALTLASSAALPGAARASETSATNLAEFAGPAPYVYRSLGPDDALCLEAMVDVMCPADDLTPSGTDCGLARYIDGQLAGPFGRGAYLYRLGPWQTGKPEHGYQSPLTPEDYFKTGLAALSRVCRQRHEMTFAELDPTIADDFLRKIFAGTITDGGFDLRGWFNGFLYPLFTEACFSDPVYGGNRDKVFWRMLGYPGLPAVYRNDMVTYRGKPHPAAKKPKSMEEFA